MDSFTICREGLLLFELSKFCHMISWTADVENFCFDPLWENLYIFVRETTFMTSYLFFHWRNSFEGGLLKKKAEICKSTCFLIFSIILEKWL